MTSDIVVIRPGIKPELEQKINQLLLNLPKTPEGKTIIAEFSQTKKFDHFPIQDSLDRIRILYQKVKDR